MFFRHTLVAIVPVTPGCRYLVRVGLGRRAGRRWRAAGELGGQLDHRAGQSGRQARQNLTWLRAGQRNALFDDLHVLLSVGRREERLDVVWDAHP